MNLKDFTVDSCTSQGPQQFTHGTVVGLHLSGRCFCLQQFTLIIKDLLCYLSSSCPYEYKQWYPTEIMDLAETITCCKVWWRKLDCTFHNIWMVTLQRKAETGLTFSLLQWESDCGAFLQHNIEEILPHIRNELLSLPEDLAWGPKLLSSMESRLRQSFIAPYWYEMEMKRSMLFEVNTALFPTVMVISSGVKQLKQL